MSIGERIKAERDARGWSQRELGERAGVQKEQISRYENERKTPEHATVERLADAFGIPVGRLYEPVKATASVQLDDVTVEATATVGTPWETEDPPYPALSEYMQGEEWKRLPHATKAQLWTHRWKGVDPTPLSYHYLAQSYLAGVTAAEAEEEARFTEEHYNKALKRGGKPLPKKE